jgi:glyoxylase-like metal-dependent hydrolase (beta-lactamase superfamily II)
MPHRHEHRHAHTFLRLAPAAPGGDRAWRLGRRRFLVDVGRRGLAVAILGGVVVACSDSDDDTAGENDTTGGDDPGGDGAGQLTWKQVPLGIVSAYVLARGNSAAVVDTGTAGSADQIGATLSTLGLDYDAVDHVVLTHHHPDHIGSLPDVMQRATNATAYAGELDIPNITGVDVAAVGDGDDVFGLQIIDTPGHTPGSISLFDPGIGLLVAGDALNGNEDGTAISGPDERFTADMATANESVVKLAALEVEAAAFGHGEPVPEDAGRLIDELV